MFEVRKKKYYNQKESKLDEKPYFTKNIDNYPISNRLSKSKGDISVLNLAGQILSFRNRYLLSDFVMQDFQIDIDWENDIINGMKMSKSEICCLLARMFIYDTEAERTRRQISDMFWNLSSLSEDIRYVLENKVPFHYYEGYTKKQVRLNCQLIGEEMLALEISDGIWGELSFKEMNAFLSHFLHGRNVGKWRNYTPIKLYTTLLKKECRESDLKVMMAFLEQNRSEKLVSMRAKELVKEKLKMDNFICLNPIEQLDLQTNLVFLVKGKLTDYILTCASLIQSYVNEDRQIVQSYSLFSIKDDEDLPVRFGCTRHCVENLDTNSSTGDQLVTRVLTFTNDNISLSRINTMTHIQNNKYRINEKGVNFLKLNYKDLRFQPNDIIGLMSLEHFDDVGGEE